MRALPDNYPEPKLNNRQYQVLRRLGQGPLPRTECNYVACSTNGPRYIDELRHRFNLTIWTERVSVIARDGRESWIGIYHLLPESRSRAKELLKEFELRDRNK